MNKLLLLILCLMVGACVSEQEQREAMNRFEETIRNQCVNRLGFVVATQEYMNCRMYYDEYLSAIGYNVSSMSFSKVQGIQGKIDSLNQQCSHYWGASDISNSDLWSCIQRLGNKVVNEAERKKELQEEEDMLKRSIVEAHKEASDDAYIKERIEIERMKLAQLTGKNPQKIYCTHRQSLNGYVKVDCK